MTNAPAIEYRCVQCGIRIRTEHPIAVVCVRCERPMMRWS